MLPFAGIQPKVDPSTFVADSARVIGDVVIGARSSIWFGAVLRGDGHSIRIGADTNIQDGAIIHIERGLYPAIVGNGCVVGHGAIVHGCRIGDNCLIGMGAVVLNGAVLGEGCIVAAGAVVTEGKEIPPGSMVMGIPAKVVRPVTDDELARIHEGAQGYVEVSRTFLAAQERGEIPR